MAVSKGSQGDTGATGAQGEVGAQGPKGDPGEGLAEWINDHPGTVLYIAIMVTASVILQFAQVFWS